MVQYYQRPENTLKRAEELLLAKQNETALQLLHDVIMSKRNRSMSLSILEPIIEKYIELSVQLKKGIMAKEALHQFKNICLMQGKDISLKRCVDIIKKNIDSFIKLSEKEVEKAQAKADKITLDSIEDLEASETPESILLSTVSGEVTKDRTDREVVTPWLKFLWEAYRTALDILRNNSRLEDLYQEITKQAFAFCLKYLRKTEFRRLCDILRQHLQNTLKYPSQPYSIDLSKDETLKRHLEARFVQLNVAAELELWQEGYRSVEDIYHLLNISKKAPKTEMLINYYEKLAKIFLVGENYLFHAAAWSKYFALCKKRKDAKEEDIQKMASTVLMSALAIPIITTAKTHNAYDDRSRMQRLCSLLRTNTMPTREVLIKEALEKNVLSHVPTELKELYNVLEVHFHPLSIGKKIKPIMESLKSNEDLSKYVKPLYKVILTRLLQQLSQIYTTIKIESVVRLVALNDNSFDSFAIEKFIMNGCKKGELNIRINHQTKSLTFESDPFASSKGSISEGPRLQSLPSEQMRMQLARLAKRLQTVVLLMNPETAEIKRENKEISIKHAIENLQSEKEKINERIKIIEYKKEHREQENTRREEEEQKIKQMKKKEEEEAEKKRLIEESQRREEERLNQIRIENEKAEAKKIAEQLAEEVKQKKVNIKPEDLETLDANKLKELQLKQAEEERREQQRKIQQITMRMDYTDRAYRLEEIPLLKKDYEEQKKTDRARYAALRKHQLEMSKIKHEEGLKLKKSMLRMYEDYKEYKVVIESRRNEFIRNEAQRELEKAKNMMKEAYRMRKIEEKRRKLREEESKRQLEEIERNRIEEENRREAEKLEKEKALAEERKRLEEQAEKQKEIDRRIAEKITKEKVQPWKPNITTSEKLPEAANSAPGKYRPPMARTGSGRSGAVFESANKYSPSSQSSAPADDDQGWQTAGTKRGTKFQNSRLLPRGDLPREERSNDRDVMRSRGGSDMGRSDMGRSDMGRTSSGSGIRRSGSGAGTGGRMNRNSSGLTMTRTGSGTGSGAGSSGVERSESGSGAKKWGNSRLGLLKK